MTLGEPRSSEQIALEEHMRKQSWEQGQIDYMGRDSFDNIWKKIYEKKSLSLSLRNKIFIDILVSFWSKYDGWTSAIEEREC